MVQQLCNSSYASLRMGDANANGIWQHSIQDGEGRAPMSCSCNPGPLPHHRILYSIAAGPTLRVARRGAPDDERTITNVSAVRHMYASPTVHHHSCLISIVSFTIQVNVQRLTYSSIFTFMCHSSSAGREFVDRVLSM
jgi:hypothetical protein